MTAASGWAIRHEYFKSKTEYFRDGRYNVAVMLSDYKDKQLTMAVTEAGLLPLYSHWKSLDTWGLNDQWIAHNGSISSEYLDNFKPDIIMSNCYFSPQTSSSWKPANKFDEMSLILKNYAEKKQYILAAAFGATPYNTHYYYVRSGFPESLDIIRRIREMDYYWFITDSKSVNFALPSSR
jgi:hypothetical protein